MTGRLLWQYGLWPHLLVGCFLAWGITYSVLEVLIYSPSPSLPPGVYIRALPLHALRLGDLVVVEPPDVVKPTIPAHLSGRPLMKEVAGLAGTHVCWDATRMAVQAAGEERHYLYAEAPPLAPQMAGCHVLGADEMLIVGHHTRSVDSRYVGPVDTKLMRFRVWPLWTKETS